MSVDVLQEKIRKLKSPILVDFAVKPTQIPQYLLQDHTLAEAYTIFCRELLLGLKGIVPGVRFSFDQFAVLGALDALSELMRQAGELGYYVVLDGPAIASPWAAERTAALFTPESPYPCDAMILDPYAGSDVIKTFLPACKTGKAVFFAVRLPNKSASELQDLMTGSRLVHAAAAELVNRYSETVYGKCGYSHRGVLTAATNGNAVMGLRSKYKRMFLLVDGLDYPGGNAKICSYGFDQFGHGAAVSVGPEITAAWAAEQTDGLDFVQQAVKSAERIKGNLARYTSIL